ncbi:hypothetical protein [Microbacterium sp. RURRCA19A]|uniref:hypothetical protein n=1 Tax=Microbacterium sp. RURRCA19A TaxID=1907391 RepID=UPI0011155584|nr:hypothetical protein [Microbacterium sp. RURRCA19A]
MPEHGYYEKRPRPEQMVFLVEKLSTNPVVEEVFQIDEHHIILNRGNKTELRIYLSNKYILSVADVIEIMKASPQINCIVSTMNYNQYSPEAKAYCRERQVGLFKSVELLGAVYHDGEKFLDYMPPRRR